MKIIGKLLCRWRGHLRGKFVATENGKRICECPRCGHRTIYKAKQ